MEMPALGCVEEYKLQVTCGEIQLGRKDKKVKSKCCKKYKKKGVNCKKCPKLGFN